VTPFLEVPDNRVGQAGETLQVIGLGEIVSSLEFVLQVSDLEDMPGFAVDMFSAEAVVDEEGPSILDIEIHRFLPGRLPLDVFQSEYRLVEVEKGNVEK
jgi:hypothetical protein